MAKYIDAEKLKAEVENIGLIPQKQADYNDGREDMKMMVLDLIDSLQQEQPSLPSNLDKAARKSAVAPFNFELDEEHIYEYPYLPIAEQKFKEGAKWQKEQTEKRWLEDRDGCFWDGVNEGKKAMKEQMMKEAVEYEVWDFSVGAYPHVNIPLDNKQYRNGDKVRIIIVKEDEK